MASIHTPQNLAPLTVADLVRHKARGFLRQATQTELRALQFQFSEMRLVKGHIQCWFFLHINIFGLPPTVILTGYRQETGRYTLTSAITGIDGPLVRTQSESIYVIEGDPPPTPPLFELSAALPQCGLGAYLGVVPFPWR